MLGLVGVRGSDVDDDALGGALTLMIATNCGGDAGVGELGIDTECDLIGQPLFIGDTVSSGVAEGLGTFVGVPTFLSAVTDDSVFALRREPGATGRVLVVEVDPRDPSENSAATTPARAPLLGGAALDECQGDGLVVLGDIAEQRLFAFGLGAGVGQGFNLDGPTEQIVYEPFSGLVIVRFPPPPPGGDAGAPFDAGSDAGDASMPRPQEPAVLRAFDAQLVGVNVSLAEASANRWDAPRDVQPQTMGVRQVIPFSCD
jgi:hypothetical protein